MGSPIRPLSPVNTFSREEPVSQVIAFSSKEGNEDKMQQKFDLSLETIWTQIQQKIDFKGEPIPANAQAIRQWLKDPANTEKIDCVTQAHLDQMNLTILPPEIGNLPNLRALYLHKNELASLPDEIGNLSKLTALFSGDNKLTSLPANIGNFPTLLALYLGNNELTSLPETIGKLSKLAVLCLGRNKLTVLPKTVGNFSKSLTELSLDSNQLRSLPDEIGQLSELTVLGLRNNRLTSLPDGMSKLLKLTTLDLAWNELTSLPDGISKLSKLTELYLYRNPLLFILDKHLQEFAPNKYSVFSRDCSRALSEQYAVCSDYQCSSPLASLCQEIHRGSGSDVLRGAFEKLSDEMKQQILHVRAERGELIDLPISEPPSSSSSSSEAVEELFADRISFVRSVIEALQKKFQKFSHEQRFLIYRKVAELYCAQLNYVNLDFVEPSQIEALRSDRRSPSPSEKGKNEDQFGRCAASPNSHIARLSLAGFRWGEAHATDNVIRLIDAMELYTQPTTEVIWIWEPFTLFLSSLGYK